MAYSIELTEKAHQELDEILFYISKVLKNPIAADRLMDEINQCFESLQEMPYQFEQCRDDRLRQEGYCRCLVRRYVVVYKVQKAARTVTIYRFFHDTQNYERFL